ncbi:MAG: glycosyl hydrolase family 28-related protein [Smithella sp.]
MFKRYLGYLFLVTFLSLTTIPCALCAQSTISINATSITDAQTTINSAINSVASGATSNNPGYVLLTAGTYNISGPIRLKSNVVLKGAGDNTIIFANGSVCNSTGAPAYIFGLNVSNVEICNLQFQSTARGPQDGGRGARFCINLNSANNSVVHDVLFTPYLYSDGVRIETGTNITVYNCRIRAGHDGISFLLGSSNCRAYNNDIDIRVNTGIRIRDAKGIRLDHNTFYGLHRKGWCCTEMEENVQIEIDHNIFHDYIGSSGNAAVQPRHASGSVSVHDNVLWNVGKISMGSGSGNIMDPSDKNVKDWVFKGYGYVSIK